VGYTSRNVLRIPAGVAVIAFALVIALRAQPARLDASTAIPYFVGGGASVQGFLDSDRELAVLALAAWSRESGGTVTFREVPADAALIRIRWISPSEGLYGETQRMTVNGKAGAIVNVMPDVSRQGDPLASLARADRLLRETVVYLTCVHEIGHALGLEHTRDVSDIMYYFGYGGDIVQYFERYRMTLRSRDDIRYHSGISAADRHALLSRYPHQ
jgi:hypothetical protein